MKKSISPLLIILFIGGLMMLLVSCTHEDQDLSEYIPPDTGPDFSTTELVAQKVTSSPTIDGLVDAMWDESQKLVTRTVVPDPGDDLFKGYVGDAYPVTLRAAYDNENIYFLAEWDDPNLDLNRQTWFYDPGTKLWKQESRYPVFNGQGAEVRMPFYEDKFAFLWNVNNSVAGWDQSSCYASCHTGLGSSSGFARHYTNAPGETIDMWHWKSVRTGPNGQLDDQYQDDAQPNGRHGDSKDGGGYSNNVQELVIANTGDTVNVPKYFIPGERYYHWIMQDKIDSEVAKLITWVKENGELGYDGGTIDPVADIEFQRDGNIVGPKGIPSIYTRPFEGNRGDLEGKANYTGSGWVLEIKRKLKTGDTEDQDVDFSDLSDQIFGIGVFDNAALAHSIKTNLTLKFEIE